MRAFIMRQLRKFTICLASEQQWDLTMGLSNNFLGKECVFSYAYLCIDRTHGRRYYGLNQRFLTKVPPVQSKVSQLYIQIRESTRFYIMIMSMLYSIVHKTRWCSITYSLIVYIFIGNKFEHEYLIFISSIKRCFLRKTIKLLLMNFPN